MDDWMQEFIYRNKYSNIEEFWKQLAEAAKGMTAVEFGKRFLDSPSEAKTLERIVRQNGLRSGSAEVDLQTLELTGRATTSPFRENGSINYAKIAETIEGLDEKQVLVIVNYGNEDEPIVFPFERDKFMKKYPTLELKDVNGRFLDHKIKNALNSVQPNQIYAGYDWESNGKIQVVQLVDIVRSYMFWRGLHPHYKVMRYPGSSDDAGREKIVVLGMPSFGSEDKRHYVSFTGVPVWETSRGKTSLQQDGSEFGIDSTSFEKTTWQNVKHSRWMKRGKRRKNESPWGYAHILAVLMLQEELKRDNKDLLLPLPGLNKMDTIRYLWKINNNVLVRTYDPKKDEYKLAPLNLNQTECLIWARIGYQKGLNSKK